MDLSVRKFLAKGVQVSGGIDVARATAHFRHMSFDRDRMKKGAAEIAAQGVYFGTSSWKYEGWLPQAREQDVEGCVSIDVENQPAALK